MALNLQHTVKPNIPGDSGHRGCGRCGGRRLQILVAWFRVQGLEVIVYRKTLNPEHLRKIGTLFERKEKETREEHRVKCFSFHITLTMTVAIINCFYYYCTYNKYYSDCHIYHYWHSYCLYYCYTCYHCCSLPR